MADKTVNIRIESLFNDAGFSRAVRAVRALQTEIGRANAGMRQMAEMARDISTSMNQAATATADLGRDIQAASTKVSRFVTNAQKASQANRDLSGSANQAASGVNNLDRSLVVAGTSAIRLVEQAGSGSRALVTLGNSARTLATASQTAGRANNEFAQGLRALYAGTIDVEARFVGATQGARMLGDGIHALSAGARTTVGSLRMLQEGARAIDNGMRMLGEGTRQATQNIIEAQFRVHGATQATRNFGSVFATARQGISSFVSIIASLNRTVSGSGMSFQQMQTQVRSTIAGARNLAQQYQRLRQNGASFSATLTTMTANQLRNHQAALRMMQGLQGVFNTINRVNNIATRLARSLAGTLTSGVMRAVRAIGQLLSAGARFAGLRSSLDATGRSASRFGADFEKGMDRANRSAMEFYAAGWSLLMSGQMIGGFGRRMIGGLTGQLDQFLGYEQARTKLGIASSGFESGQNVSFADQNKYINNMVFGLQRGTYGNALPMDAASLAQGAYYYSSALGTPITNQQQADAIAKSLAPILSVASYTESSPEATIKGVLNAAMEFGIDPRAEGADKELSRIAGQFGYLTQVSTLELPDIVETFKMMGPMVNQLGGTDNHQNLNDAMLMTFLASEMGMRGSQVGRGLNQAMNSFLDPTDKMNAVSQQLFGGDVRSTFFDKNNHLKGGLTGFLGQFMSLDEGEWQQALAQMFTTNATRALIPIIEQMRDNPEKVLDFTKGISGDEPLKLTDAAMARYNDSIAGHLQQVKNAWFEVQSAIVDAIQGPFKKALELLTHLFREVADVINDHPAIAKFITTLTAGIGVILSIVGTMLTLAGTLLILRRAFMMTHGAVTILFHVITALPALLAVGVPLILALAAAAVLLHRAWQSNFLGIQDIVAKFTGDLSYELEPILDNLEKLARRATELFSGFVNTQFDNFVALMRANADAIRAVLDVLAEFGKGAVEGIGGSIMVAVAAFQALLRVLREVPGALKWLGTTIRDLTGFSASAQEVAHALGIAFGVVMVGLAVRSMRVFNNSVTRGTLSLIRFIATNVLLRGVLLTFQLIGRVASLSFSLMISAINRTIFALARFVAAQVAANAVVASSRIVMAGTFLGVIAIIGLVVAAFIHLMQTNQEFHDNVVTIFNNLKGIILDFATGVLVGLVAGFYAVWTVVGPFFTFIAQNAIPAIEGLLQAVARSLAPWSEWANRMNAAQYAGMALGLAITALTVKLGIDLVAAIVMTIAKLIIMTVTLAVQTVAAMYSAVAATIAWIVALGPLGIAIIAMIAAAGALVLILDHLGAIQDPFKTLKDSANAAIGVVSLLWDWLHKTNEEQAQSDYKSAQKDLTSYQDKRYEQAKSDSNTYYQDRIVFPNDPVMQSAYERYQTQGGTLTARQWFETNGRTVVNTEPDAEQTRLQQRVSDTNSEVVRLSQQNNLARSYDGTVDGGSTSGPTGISFLDNLISGWSIDRVLKATGIDMSALQGQMAGLGSFNSYAEWEKEAKEQAKKLYIGQRYKELTKRDLDVDEYMQGMSNIPGVFPAGTSFVDTEALNQANQDYVDAIEDGAAQAEDAFKTFSDSFYSAIATIDLPSALKGIFDSSLGQGGVSAASVLGTYGDTIMTNLQNAVGSGVTLPWQNSFELMMDAAGSGASLGQNMTGKNLHKALAPYLETFAAQSGVSVESLLADIPTFYAPEQYLGMGQADLIQAAQLLPTDMYKRLDTLGAGEYNANGIDWQELANFGTANAAAGNLDWNLADFISEAWDISKDEAETYIKNHQLDPNVITGQDFFDTKLYADSLGGKVNVMTEDWWNYVQEVTQGGADKTIEITQSAFDALPDVIKIGMSNMGYQFVIGGNQTSQQMVATAEQIKKHIEDTYTDIPWDKLAGNLKDGWTAIDSDADGLIEIRDKLGNLQFTIPAGDYQAWIDSNDTLAKEKRRLKRLKDDLVDLKEQIRQIATLRDDTATKAANAGSYSQFSTQVSATDLLQISGLDGLKEDLNGIREDLGWITGEGGTPPKIDIAGMMPSADDIKKAGAQAAEDFATGFSDTIGTKIGDNLSIEIDLSKIKQPINDIVTDLGKIDKYQAVAYLLAEDNLKDSLIFAITTLGAINTYQAVAYLLVEDSLAENLTYAITTLGAINNYQAVAYLFAQDFLADNLTYAITTLGAINNYQAVAYLFVQDFLHQNLVDAISMLGQIHNYQAVAYLLCQDFLHQNLVDALSMLGQINGYTATATVTVNHQDNYSSSTIPGNAQGGMMFRGGLSLVGEYGPELVHLGAGSRVIPSNLSMPMVQNMVNRKVDDMVGTRGGYQSHAFGEGGGSTGGGGGDFKVEINGDLHFHNGTDMDDLVERLDTFYGRRVEMLKRGQYGGDSARHRTT